MWLRLVRCFLNAGLSSTKAPPIRLARRSRSIQDLPLRPNLPCLFSMRSPESDSDPSERVSKRRRISSPARKDLHATMTPTGPRIELTPIESTLRALLLDVAQYINEQAAEGKASNVQDSSKTVLRFTGGWVRDKLLGIGSNDIDVGISNMTGYQFGMALKEYLDVPERLEKYKQSLPNGQMHDAIVSLHKIEANPEKSKHLETVTTKIFGLDIDLVNLRKETYTDDSRNPQMEFGTAVEDALRRDATINALFYNLNESQLEDLTERGLDDMKHRIIRCPMEPYQTFKDDPLRVLRLIRFASRLGYQIDSETEAAMQIEDIGEALKLKISKERVGTELEKMLRGPDPRGALEFIDRLKLYHTIFANHQDDIKADTSTWPLAYNTLARLLRPDSGNSQESEATIKRIREILFRDESTIYYAWMVATFAPWSSIPTRPTKGPKGKPLPPRTVEVGRDSLRTDNKNLTVLRAGSQNYEEIIETKTALLTKSLPGTPAEIRQKIGLLIRAWNKEWKLCILLAILQETMAQRDFSGVAQEYDQFLAYIVENDLEDVCDLRPIVNGDEIMNSLGAKKGPWMGKAVNMSLEWQLLHPEISDKEKALAEIVDRRAELGFTSRMEELRKARATLAQTPGKVPDSLPFAGTAHCGIDQLWQDIDSQDHSTHSDVSFFWQFSASLLIIQLCESLLLATGVIRNRDFQVPDDTGPRPLSPIETKAITNLFTWASRAALPSSEFASYFDETAGFSDDIIQCQIDSRFRSELAMDFLLESSKLLPNLSKPSPDNVADVLLAGACFKESTPWTTSYSHGAASKLLDIWTQSSRKYGTFWPAIDLILRERIRPLFAKQKNPAITSAGRKNFHPQALPRFGSNGLDESAKPWKTTDIYVASVLSWVLSQYKPEDKSDFEAHFPLFVPTVLAMIDDNNLPFKTEGCLVLSQLLQAIQASESDILRRTNLTSVFEEAVTPCLLSIPTITPEDRSLKLLGAAYPALLDTLQTAYKGPSQSSQNREAYTNGLANILRSNLISSFHHISSSTPASGSTAASFPFPRLSAFLLEKISLFISELGIHATKYLQELIPVLYTTLSNPFGTAYPPLLRAAATATQVIIQNAHPRIWRWRGEILSGLSSCWLHIAADDNKENAPQLVKLKVELQQATKLLQHVLQNPVPISSDTPEPGQVQAKLTMHEELKELTDADAELRLLFE
ncbi:unnamed protein product [Penicillium olsonii]|nr:unnamed protein product [Penicillium olsonii]